MKNKILYLLLTVGITLTVIFNGCKKENIFEQKKGEFKDSRDGSVYKWVKIGDQVWMAENLHYTGDDIQHITDNDEWENNTDYDGWCYYENNENYGSTYGVLYQWEAAKMACPSGWHLPTEAEWTKLKDYLKDNNYSYDSKTDKSGIAKSLSTATGWATDDYPGVVGNDDYPNYQNKTGFSAIPGGSRCADGDFCGLGYEIYWWCATQHTKSIAYDRAIYYNKTYIWEDIDYKSAGAFVRCIKD